MVLTTVAPTETTLSEAKSVGGTGIEPVRHCEAVQDLPPEGNGIPGAWPLGPADGVGSAGMGRSRPLRPAQLPLLLPLAGGVGRGPLTVAEALGEVAS